MQLFRTDKKYSDDSTNYKCTNIFSQNVKNEKLKIRLSDEDSLICIL